MKMTAEISGARFLGASDAPKIMKGEWKNLWRQKTGREPEEDLSDNLAVQMGKWTEPFNACWYSHVTGRAVRTNTDIYKHPDYYWLTATPDGFVVDEKVLWQAKHTGEGKTQEEMLQRCTAQLHHEMTVMGVLQSDLSVFYGNRSYGCIRIAYDFAYAGLLLRREQEFWAYVETDEEPEDRPDLIKGSAPAKIISHRIIDMKGRNEWATHAADWLGHRQAARWFKDAEKGLKAMVEGDVARAHGHGIEIVRDRAGKLSIREMKEPPR